MAGHFPLITADSPQRFLEFCCFSSRCAQVPLQFRHKGHDKKQTKTGAYCFSNSKNNPKKTLFCAVSPQIHRRFLRGAFDPIGPALTRGTAFPYYGRADSRQRARGPPLSERKIPMFTVTKHFVDGALAGLTIEDPYCPAPFTVGRVYGGHGFGSRYRVIACRKGVAK